MTPVYNPRNCRLCDQCHKPKCVCDKCHNQEKPYPVVTPMACTADECDKRESNVRICSFTVKNKSEVRNYFNALVYCLEDNTSYWVDNDGNAIITYRLPIYENDWNPETETTAMNTVYDFKNNIAYVYNPAGEYRTFKLEGGSK